MEKDKILILSYSEDHALETAKKLRGNRYYALVAAGDATAEQVRKIAPRGIILCGRGTPGTGSLDEEILHLGIPVLAMGHASHLLLAAMGGASARTVIKGKRTGIHYGQSEIFRNVPDGDRNIEEAVMLMLPANVEETANGNGCSIAFESREKKQYGIQFAVESNDTESAQILLNFARICQCDAWFTQDAIRVEIESRIHALAEKREAICAVSGGLDSVVTAYLMYKVFGDRMKAVFVDTGLMRENEGERIATLLEKMNIPLIRTDCSEQVFAALQGTSHFSQRKQLMTQCLREAVIGLGLPDDVIVLGTDYADALKGHQDWGQPGIELQEPLALLFREEIGELAKRLGLDEEIVQRKPFPPLGLAAYLIGDVTPERIDVLRRIDSIFREEIREAGISKKLYAYYPLLADKDPISGGKMVVLRAVNFSGGSLRPARLPHDLVERTVQRILEADPSIKRVYYDETPVQQEKSLV